MAHGLQAQGLACPSVVCRSVDGGSTDAPVRTHLSRTKQSVVVQAVLFTMKILNKIFWHQTTFQGWNKQIKSIKTVLLCNTFNIQSTEQSACLNEHKKANKLCSEHVKASYSKQIWYVFNTEWFSLVNLMGLNENERIFTMRVATADLAERCVPGELF